MTLMEKKSFAEIREKIEEIRLDAAFEREKSLLSHKDENGVYHIDVCLNSNEEAFSALSNGKKLNPEAFEYIEETAKEFPLDAPLSVDFVLSKELYGRKEEIKSLYQKHYLYRFDEIGSEKKRSRLAIVAMAFGGILFLLAFAIVSAFSNHLQSENAWLHFAFLVATELLSTAEWVLFWEAFDKLFFDSNERKAERLFVGRLAASNLSFKQKEDNEL